MGDVFIIHTASSREFACKAASQLAGEGSSVIRREAASLTPELIVEAAGGDAVIVIWAPDAPPPPMIEAAKRALARRVLVPVAIGGGEPPRGFSHLWPIDLDGWTGDVSDPRWHFVHDEIDLARRRAVLAPKPRRRVRPAGARRPAKSRSDDTKLLLRIIPPAAAGLAVLSAAAVRFAEPIAPPAPAGRELPVLMHLEAASAAEGSSVNAPATDRIAAAPGGPKIEPMPETAFDAAPEPAGAPPVMREGGDALTLVSVSEATAPRSDLPAPAEEERTVLAALAAEPTPALPAGDVAEGDIGPAQAEAEPEPEALPLPPPAPDDFLGVVFRDCLNCPDMAEIPAGSFEMGAPEGEEGAQPEESPVRTVTISKRFALSRREITFDDWGRCVEAGGCAAYQPADSGWGRGKRPVINVSFEDAQRYVAWLTAETGHAYRLPTEAEWEYAARAGSRARPATKAVFTPMLANYEDGARLHTAPAGSFAPNAFGLYDMFGNVWEWVTDCWRDSHVSLPADGSAIGGPCEARVLKGGAFNSSLWRLRPAHRISKGAGARESDNGFRVARDLP